MRGLIVSREQKNPELSFTDDLEPPAAGPGQVIVNIKASSMNPYDLESVAGRYDLYFRMYGVKHPVQTGLEFAGIVATDGQHFKTGDRVFGYVHMIRGQKTHQESIAIAEDHMSHLPASLDFVQGAALPLGALTSLVALRETGELKKDQQVLINGAAGGVGIYATQIARLLGAQVTAVAGPGQSDFLQELGADHTIDYTEENIFDSTEKFDLILDFTARLKFRGPVRTLLMPGGRFIPADPIANVADFIYSLFGSKRAKWLLVDRGNRSLLAQIAAWVEQGLLRPVVDRQFQVQDYQQGLERLQAKQKRGRIVLVWP